MIRSQDTKSAYPHPTGEIYTDSTDVRVDSGLEYAAHEGFSLDQALKVARGDLDDDAIGELKEQIKGEMAHITVELGLSAEYFKSSANIVALAAVAQTSLENTARRDQGVVSHDKWEMGQAELYDAVLVFAGKDSQRALSFARHDSQLRDKYIGSKSEQDRVDAEFLDSINDHEQAESVAAILKNTNFLDEQLQALGLTREDERPFRVRVLKAGKSYDLQRSGLIPQKDHTNPYEGMDIFNLTDQQRAEANEKVQLIREQEAIVDAAAAIYETNLSELDKRFGADRPVAFVTHTPGEADVVLTIDAIQARYLERFADGVDGEGFQPYEVDGIERDLATIRHEWCHTQRFFHKGGNTQLGMLMEERKAEYASGDRGGYVDIKLLFKDVSYVSGIDITEMTSNAAMTENPLDTFMVQAANRLGLRGAYLLATIVPTPYKVDNKFNHDRLVNYVSHDSRRIGSDHSDHDMMLREMVNQFGSERLKAHLESWAARVVTSEEKREWLIEQWVTGYRGRAGLTACDDLYIQAINAVELPQP